MLRDRRHRVSERARETRSGACESTSDSVECVRFLYARTCVPVWHLSTPVFLFRVVNLCESVAWHAERVCSFFIFFACCSRMCEVCAGERGRGCEVLPATTTVTSRSPGCGRCDTAKRNGWLVAVCMSERQYHGSQGRESPPTHRHTPKKPSRYFWEHTLTHTRLLRTLLPVQSH